MPPAPISEYPYPHTDAVDDVTWSDADLHNVQGKAIKTMMNSLPMFKVDPNDPTHSYASLAAAWAVADVKLPAGAEARFLLADGTYSDNIDFGTDHPVVIESVNYRGAIITGNLTFGNYAALTRHEIRGCDLDTMTVTVKDGTGLLFNVCRIDTVAFVLNPSAGSVGYDVRLQNCDVITPTITETAAPTASVRSFVIDGAQCALESASGTPISIYKLRLHFANIGTEKLEWAVFTNPLIDCNSDSPTVRFTNFAVKNFHTGGVPTDWFTNAGSCAVEFVNATFQAQSSTKTMAFGTFGTQTGVPTIVAAVEPLNCPSGTIWRDTGNNRSATYQFHASFPYWKWDNWSDHVAEVGSGGDAVASTGLFANINQAFAALNAALAADVDPLIKVRSGETHTVSPALALPSTRKLLIETYGTGQGDNTNITLISGDFTLPDASGGSDQMLLQFRNVKHSGTINAEANWDIRYEDCHFSGTTINRDHTAGIIRAYFFRCSGDPSVTDTGGGGPILARGCNFVWIMLNTTVFSLGASGVLELENSILQVLTLGGAANNLVDFNSAATGQVYWRNSSFQITKVSPSDPFELYANELASSQAYYYTNTDFFVATNSNLDFNAGTMQSYGSFSVVTAEDAALPPISNVPTGARWTDRNLNDGVWQWDGTYWRRGDMIKQFALIPIGVAALDHDATFDLPAGAVALSGSVNLNKALTGAGGAIQVGFGTGAVNDPDEFCETSALTLDAKGQRTAVVGSGALDLKITAETGPGASGGTVAGSGTDDVRALLYSRVPVTLPNA